MSRSISWYVVLRHLSRNWDQILPAPLVRVSFHSWPHVGLELDVAELGADVVELGATTVGTVALACVAVGTGTRAVVAAAELVAAWTAHAAGSVA